jgi:hypothetical protein
MTPVLPPWLGPPKSVSWNQPDCIRDLDSLQPIVGSAHMSVFPTRTESGGLRFEKQAGRSIVPGSDAKWRNNVIAATPTAAMTESP